MALIKEVLALLKTINDTNVIAVDDIYASESEVKRKGKKVYDDVIMMDSQIIGLEC